MLETGVGDGIEGSNGVVDHAGIGVEGDDANEEALRSGEFRVKLWASRIRSMRLGCLERASFWTVRS